MSNVALGRNASFADGIVFSYNLCINIARGSFNNIFIFFINMYTNRVRGSLTIKASQTQISQETLRETRS